MPPEEPPRNNSRLVGDAEVMAQIGSAGITSGLPVIRPQMDGKQLVDLLASHGDSQGPVRISRNKRYTYTIEFWKSERMILGSGAGASLLEL